MDSLKELKRLESEREELVQRMFAADSVDGKPDCSIVKQLLEKDDRIKKLLESHVPDQGFFKREMSPSLWRIYHNEENGRMGGAPPFQVQYIHPEALNNKHVVQVRVEDLGIDLKSPTQFDIGIGICNMRGQPGENQREFGMDIGFLSNDVRTTCLEGGGARVELDCFDTLSSGDVIKFEVTDKHVLVSRDGRTSYSKYPYNTDKDEYKIFIGMNNCYEKVTLAYNQSLGPDKEAIENFPKKDLIVYVASMNEGSPRYAEGVANGGKHLLQDGMLIRKLNRRVVNYQPGFICADAKLGGEVTCLEYLLPEGLLRNRINLGDNMLSVFKRGEEYQVDLKSLLTNHKEKFIGSNAEWEEEKAQRLGKGEKYLIALPTRSGQIQTNTLLIAGNKCKTIHSMMYNSLTHKVRDTEKTPAVLLLGGDRCQSIGSITGALRAYKDLCTIFFDAHFDFRDPDATEYPIVHGSPLFFLLQSQLRDAISDWNKMNSEEQKRFPDKRDAINFINSTREGRDYWASLQQSSVGYRGFHWLQGREMPNPHRVAFVGARQKTFEAGSGLGSPLVSLFLHLLDLQPCIYTETQIKSEGVTKVFEKIINQFRGTFSDEYVKLQDVYAPNGKWIPPIMVSWDVDSIDPKDMPCTIAQEANGLTNEECLAFSDKFAATQRLVAMEIVEFNPDLWGGYLDEQCILSLKEFRDGPYARAPREPSDKNNHRIDIQTSTTLLQNMIQRALNDPNKEV